MANRNKQIKYYRNKGIIPRLVRGSIAKNKQVVHGARAINAQLPGFLRKETKDYDVFVKNPSKAAKMLEKSLDKKFRGDFFRVKKGSSEVLPVRKVVSNITNESLVDFARPKRKIPFTTIQGVRYATLEYHKGQIKRTLKDPSSEFRKEKDLEALQRIKLFQNKS